jgi:outer membrane receptor protein involved in Fe transport
VTSGNTKLQPITAKDWDIGAVWSPLSALSFSVDYLHFGITNEVEQQSADLLLREDALCLLGQLSPTSPTCVAALSQVTRDPNTGQVTEVYTPKINVAKELVNVFIASGDYHLKTDRFGAFEFKLAWTDMLDHSYQQFADEAAFNLLTNPIESQEFKSKVDGSITWMLGDFSATAYATRDGATPNYLATVNGYGTAGAGTLAAWTVYNFSASYKLTKGLELTFIVDNVFNAMPPVDHSYPGTETQPYDEFDYNVYGPAYYLEVNYKIGL